MAWLERTLNAALEKPLQIVVGKEASPVAVEGRKVVCSTFRFRKRLESVIRLIATVSRVMRTRQLLFVRVLSYEMLCVGECNLSTVDASTDAFGDEKSVENEGDVSGVSERMSIVKDQHSVARESVASMFSCARSAQAIGDLN